jgi:hypothetical protein
MIGTFHDEVDDKQKEPVDGSPEALVEDAVLGIYGVMTN